MPYASALSQAGRIANAVKPGGTGMAGLAANMSHRMYPLQTCKAVLSRIGGDVMRVILVLVGLLGALWGFGQFTIDGSNFANVVTAFRVILPDKTNVELVRIPKDIHPPNRQIDIKKTTATDVFAYLVPCDFVARNFPRIFNSDFSHPTGLNVLDGNKKWYSGNGGWDQTSRLAEKVRFDEVANFNASGAGLPAILNFKIKEDVILNGGVSASRYMQVSSSLRSSYGAGLNVSSPDQHRTDAGNKQRNPSKYKGTLSPKLHILLGIQIILVLMGACGSFYLFCYTVRRYGSAEWYEAGDVAILVSLIGIGASICGVIFLVSMYAG
ncbi:hypothetical protein [Hoeflea sp.]|uniref:hypothetical protein n=1 Tax=Hoeflea sp. TaxID=1940281 RepID=UPI003A95170D